jgi:hypothetical protein
MEARCHAVDASMESFDAGNHYFVACFGFSRLVRESVKYRMVVAQC